MTDAAQSWIRPAAAWLAMLEAYTFKGGNIWPIVLAVTFFAPLIALRGRPGT